MSEFDTDKIEDFSKDKEVIEIRDHFFMVGGCPRLTIILTYNSAEFSKEPITKDMENVRENG